MIRRPNSPGWHYIASEAALRDSTTASWPRAFLYVLRALVHAVLATTSDSTYHDSDRLAQEHITRRSR